MHNKPGRGPTRNDKTTERMAQESASPGSSTDGVPGAGTPGGEPTSARRGGVVANPAASVQEPSRTPRAPSASHEDLVREAAYRRFERRGFVEGHAEEDWLEAERELRSSRRSDASNV